MACCIGSSSMLKRKLVCVLLGTGFGFICAYLASIGPDMLSFWWSPLMWVIVFNRFLIGVVVFLAGAFKKTPCGCRLFSWFRGLTIGAIVSLDLAIGVFMNPTMPEDQQCLVFWSTIIVGAIYGMLIDVIATKIAGDGESLLTSTCGRKK